MKNKDWKNKLDTIFQSAKDVTSCYDAIEKLIEQLLEEKNKLEAIKELKAFRAGVKSVIDFLEGKKWLEQNYDLIQLKKILNDKGNVVTINEDDDYGDTIEWQSDEYKDGIAMKNKEIVEELNKIIIKIKDKYCKYYGNTPYNQSTTGCPMIYKQYNSAIQTIEKLKKEYLSKTK
jgi:hypothetical protein